MDTYSSYGELSKTNRDGVDYRIRFADRGSSIAVFAPHGGGIDLGSSEIAEAIAGDDFSFYFFLGIKRAGNSDLHIASDRFDEPKALRLASAADLVVAVHGCAASKEIVYAGGLHEDLKERIAASLNNSGFHATTDTPPNLAGRDPANICNRGLSGKGVQIEISAGLRKKMFQYLSSRVGRKSKTKTFYTFVKTIRKVLQHS